jgi:hypothetical protein
MKTSIAALLVIAGLSTAACGGDNAIPTPAPIGPSTEIFDGTLQMQGSSFFSFTVQTSGSVSITLASLIPTKPGPALNTVMDLGVGQPLETDCNVTSSVAAAPALVPQLVNTLTPATYCARISDLGNLTTPVTFTIRIVHN